MAITYNNTDEIVKVKHILSLAEHIAEKINGSGSSSSTTSKQTPTLSASITTFSAATFIEDDQGEKRRPASLTLPTLVTGNLSWRMTLF